MPWLFLLLAAGAMAVAFKTQSILLMMLALLGGLGFTVAATMMLLAQRIERRSGDISSLVDPAELHRLREQAEARRAAAVSADPESPVT